MRKFLMLSSAVFLITVPAMAADVKQEIEKTELHPVRLTPA
jgi:hypothetical protein